jgi:hypothetical protein
VALALGGRILQAQEDTFPGSDDVGYLSEQQRGDEAGFVSEGAEEVVVAFEVRAETGGAEPGGDGTSALGEEEAAQQRQQGPGVAGVQGRGEVSDPQDDLGRQGPCEHASAPLLRRRVV